MATLKATVRQPQRLTASVYKYLSHSHPLSELTQSGAADKDVIKWDQALGQWKAGRVDWSELSGIVAGSNGEVVFWGQSGDLKSSSGFVWDDTNSRLGIGNPNPGGKLDIIGSAAQFVVADDGVLNIGSANAGQVLAVFYDGTSQPRLKILNDGQIEWSDPSTYTFDLSINRATGKHLYVSPYLWVDQGFTIGSSIRNGLVSITGKSDEVQLYVKAVTGQTQDIVQIQDAGGARYFAIESNGKMYVKTYAAFGALTLHTSNGIYHTTLLNNRIKPAYNAPMYLLSGEVDKSSSEAFQFDTSSDLVTSGAKLNSWKNKGVEKAFLSHEGEWVSRALASPTVSLGANQFVFYLDEANNKLKVKVVYSDGTTTKIGEIALI